MKKLEQVLRLLSWHSYSILNLPYYCYYIVIAFILIEELFNHYRRVLGYIVNSIIRSGLGSFCTIW